MLAWGKMSDSLPRSLSREEQEEVAQSKKKVKDVSHVGFQSGQEAGIDVPKNGQGAWSGSASFKDMLVGEIPGAYTQAFCFGDSMDEEADSDVKVDTIRKGLVAVKFSKEIWRDLVATYMRMGMTRSRKVHTGRGLWLSVRE